MSIVVILQIIVLLGAIFIGVRLGGIGIGYAGGAGVLVLGLLLGMKPGNIPWDVILIIASVISAISAMQLAGGLDYLVQNSLLSKLNLFIYRICYCTNSNRPMNRC